MKLYLHNYRKLLLIIGFAIICCQPVFSQGTIDFENTNYTAGAYIGSTSAVFSTAGGHSYKIEFNNASSAANFKIQAGVPAGSANKVLSVGNILNTGDKITITDNDGVSVFSVTSLSYFDLTKVWGPISIKGYEGAKLVGNYVQAGVFPDVLDK